MPIGLVSDLDFQREIESLGTRTRKESHPPSPKVEIPTSQVISQVIDIPKRGRSNGDNNVPESLRKIIGETAVIDGRPAALSLAKDFGISPSSVSAYARGATSTTSYNSPKESIISHINKSRQRAIKRASKTLNAALGAITQEKLDYSDAKDLSGIAKDMAVVIKNLEPPNSPTDSQSSAPQFVIFAPTFRDERTFDVIHTNE